MNIPKTVMRLLLGKRLPKTSGAIQVDGLTASLQIRRDQYGVPYISAQNEADAWYGLGFCHGQDRPFQLETLRRVVRGELAELFGPDLLPVDRLSRRIGYHRAGLGHLEIMPESQRKVIQAYVDGINNAYLRGLPRKAHEFVLLRSSPTPWTEADITGLLNYMGMHLSVWTSKLTRLYVLKHDGLDALAPLDSGYPAWLPVSDPVQGLAGEAVSRLVEDARRLVAFTGEGASNNWALDGSRTLSGNPILANDPHLSPSLPAPWYLAHVSYPELQVCGASFVGIPLIPSGFNGSSAWGVTAGLVDNIDLYIEQLDIENTMVRNPSGYEACRTLQESYRIKGQEEPFEEAIWITPRGPIVSDLMEGFDEALSMKATWMDPRPVDGLTAFHKATDFQTCRENFEHLYTVSLNVAYADTSGTIGWQLIGEAPRRKKGWGVLPMPGWEPDYDWGQDHVSLDELPWLMDPEQGFLATANNLPRKDGEGPYLGRDFAAYRQARIFECLDSRRDWDLELTRELQLDQFSIPWREIRETVLSIGASQDDAVRSLKLLRDWDGVLRVDSAPAAVCEFFFTDLAQHLAQRQAPNSFHQVLGKGFSTLFPGSAFFIQNTSLISRLLREQPAGWFGESWEAVIENSLAAAYGRLREMLGAEEGAWHWGDVHKLVLSHQFGSRKPLDRIFNRGPFPLGGNGKTVATAGRLVGKFGSNVMGMPNLRMAVEVGDWEKNYFVLAGGQSGNPLSPHYDDQLAHWLQGQAISIAWAEETIAAAAQTRLDLLPTGQKA